VTRSSTLCGVLHQRHQPGVVPALAAGGVEDAAQHVADPVAEHVGVQVGGLDELGHLRLEVVLEPRDGGELQLVGHLVQAHPQPEVTGVDAQPPLGVDDVRGDQQQPATGAEDLVLAEHAGGEEGEHAAGLHPGGAGADGGGQRAGPGLLPGGERVDQRVEQRGHPLGVGVHPAGPVDHGDLGYRTVGDGAETGEALDVRDGGGGGLVQLTDDRGGLFPRRLRAGADQAAGGASGEVPVHHPCGAAHRPHVTRRKAPLRPTRPRPEARRAAPSRVPPRAREG
jgi:hypothetical protein